MTEPVPADPTAPEDPARSPAPEAAADADAPATTKPACAVSRWLDDHAWILAACVAVVFLVVGLSRLDTYLPNPDEGIYYRVAVVETLESARAAIRGNAHPPLFFLLARAVASVDSSIAAMRLPSLLSAVLAILGAYWLGRRLANPLTGVLAALGLALSPALQAQAVLLRPYAMLLACVVLGVLFLVRTVDRARVVDAVGTAVFLGLAAALHYAANVVIAGLGTWLLVLVLTRRLRGRTLAATVAALVPAVAIAAWFFFTHVTQRLMGSDLQAEARGSAEAARSGWLRPLFLDAPALWDGFLYLFLYLFGAAVGAVALLAFANGAVVAAATRRHAVWAIPAAVLLWAAGLSMAWLYPFGGSRHALYLLPFVAVPIAYGLAHWLLRGPATAVAAAAAIGLGLWLSTPLTSAFGHRESLAIAAYNGAPYLDLHEQLTPLGKFPPAREQLARLKQSPGYVLMNQPTFLTLLPVLLPDMTEIVHKVRHQYKTFHWGRRRVFVENSWSPFAFSGPGFAAPSHLLRVVKRISASAPGKDFDKANDVALIMSGWIGEADLTEIGVLDVLDENELEGALIHDAVHGPGYVAVSFDLSAYYTNQLPYLVEFEKAQATQQQRRQKPPDDGEGRPPDDGAGAGDPNKKQRDGG